MTCPTCGTFPVLDWLESKGVRLGPGPAFVIRDLFEHAGDDRYFSDVTERVRASDATIRNWFKKKQIPPTGKWVLAARALAIVELAAENPHLQSYDIAERAGYGDHSGPVHLLRRCFGLGLTEVRNKHYDPAELMDRWWERMTK